MIKINVPMCILMNIIGILIINTYTIAVIMPDETTLFKLGTFHYD